MQEATAQRQIERELDAIREAMLDIIEGGQKVTIGDMSYDMANIGALQKREQYLESKLARMNGTRPAVLPFNASCMLR